MSSGKITVPRFNYRGEDADLSNVEGYEQLSTLQRLFLYAALYGRLNILFSGAAGSGKSFCLNYLNQIGRRLGLRIFFTSTTGVSAVDLPNGMTLHSYLQLGLAEGDPRELARKGAQKREIKQRILSTDILVIDEVSMASARLLDVVNLLGQAVHKSPLPYGGKLQVILVGDFGQIPPVHKPSATFRQNPTDEDSVAYLNRFVKLQYCFQHPEWSKLVDCVISLEKVFRQSDTQFVDLLNRLRFGRHTPEDIALLQSKSVKSEQEVDPECVYMFAINQKVDEKNDTEMRKLAPNPKSRVIFRSRSKMNKANPFNTPVFQTWLEDQKKSCLAKPTIELAVGAKVMLVANVDVLQGLVNGSIGRISSFNPLNGFPVVQFPVRKENNNNKKRKSMEGESEKKMNFSLGDFQEVEISPHKYKYEDPTAVIGNEQEDKKQKSFDPSNTPHVIYEQIPLRVAYAISVHKSQGRTIGKIYISAKEIFEYGQLYVALSRATSLEGVVLTDFHPKCIRAHPLVIAFYDQLRVQNERYVHRLDELMRTDLKTESQAMTTLVREMNLQKQNRLHHGQSLLTVSSFFQKNQ